MSNKKVKSSKKEAEKANKVVLKLCIGFTILAILFICLAIFAV